MPTSPLEIALAKDLGKLRFAPELEAQFVTETFPSRKRLLMVCGVIGWFGVLLGSANNAQLIPDILHTANIVVVLLLSLIAVSLASSFFTPQSWQTTTLFEGITALNTSLVTAAVIWNSVASQTITAATHSAGLVGVILYATIAARQRFRWALATALLSLLSYLLLVKGITPLHQLIIEANMRMMGIATAFALLASYSFEHGDRKGWLLHKLDQERRATLQHTNDQLRELSIRDPLSGLYNRRQFEGDLDKAWSQAAFSQQPVAMLLVDVDHFKLFNDTHGHPAGDACLQAVSKALQAVADAHQGTAGRLGGEEFGLLLPGRTRDAAVQIGEQVCQSVRALSLAHGASDAAAHVTVSVGAAVAWPGTGASRGLLFQRVDEALYEAKHAGRDRICAALDAAEGARAAPTTTAEPEGQTSVVPEVIRLPEPQDAQLSELDQLLARGFKRLRFPARIESGYQADRDVGRRKHLALTGLFGLILVNLYTIMSRGMFPDVADSMVNAQLIISGVMMCLLTVFALPLKPWMSESTYAAAVSLIGVVSVMVMAQSRTLTVLSHIVVLFVIPFFAGVVARQPFWYTCVPSIITVVACATLMQARGPIEAIVLADSLFIITNATVYTLIAAYTLDHGQRKSWLLAQIETRQRQALTVATRQLQTLSMLDPLTGIYNRRQFEADFARIWKEGREDGTPVAMLIIDVDFFKLYNDHHGHPAGDRVLKHVAALIAQTAVAHKGIAARLGGEEFGILLPRCALLPAMRVGELVRQAIRQARIEHRASAVASHLTISVGAACLDPRDEPHTRQLLALADDGLYQAKAAGRDQVGAVGVLAPSMALATA